MNIKLLIAIALFFALLTSCNRTRKETRNLVDTQLSELKKATPPQHSDNQTSAKEREKIPVGALQVGNADTASVPLQVKTASNPDWDKKIIRTAHVKIEVTNFQQYNDNIHTIVKHFGGYVAQEEQHATDEKRKPRSLSKCLWISLTI